MTKTLLSISINDKKTLLNDKNTLLNDKKTLHMIPLYSKQLFFFFLIVSGNYIAQLLSCKIQKQFSENRIVKHILGFMTMYFFVTFVDKEQFIKPLWSVLTAFLLYIWFICISVTANYHTIIIIGLLFLIYVSNIFIEYNIKKERQQNKIQRLEKIKRYLQLFLFIIAILLTIYSTTVYIGQKKIEYGNKFNYKTFFLGKTHCKFNGPDRRTNLDDISYIMKALNLKN